MINFTAPNKLAMNSYSCISSGRSCGFIIPGTASCCLRFSSAACLSWTSLSSRNKSIGSSPAYSYTDRQHRQTAQTAQSFQSEWTHSYTQCIWTCILHSGWNLVCSHTNNQLLCRDMWLCRHQCVTDVCWEFFTNPVTNADLWPSYYACVHSKCQSIMSNK